MLSFYPKVKSKSIVRNQGKTCGEKVEYLVFKYPFNIKFLHVSNKMN